MRQYIIPFFVLVALLSLTSCGKEIFYSGEMVIDGTTVRYLVGKESRTLMISAEGSTPTAPIYVKLLEIQSSNLTEKIIDSIGSIPPEKSVTLDGNCDYDLFLEKNEKTIGIGQFSL